MKKVLFMVINMNVGGTEKALLNMIEEMPEDEYEITMLMLENYGEFLDSVPGRVKIEYVKEYRKLKTMVNNPPFFTAGEFVKKGKVVKGANLALVHLLSKLAKDRTIFFRFIFRRIPAWKEEYDIAVAYAGPMDFISYFIAKKVKAKKKIQWIHFDVTKIGFDNRFAERVYGDFDNVYAVSEEGSRKLIRMLPGMKEKISVFKNIITPKLLLSQAETGKGFEDTFDGIRILTVGRLSKEKGQDLIIPVLAKLKEDGHHVRWYCIGEGKARKEYERLIKDHEVEKEFILLGATPNPYPFMKQCDIYVQPSRHEGYCITLAEAKCFNKPIVTTDFTGAKEQLKDTGTVVEFSEDKVYGAVKDILSKTESDNPGSEKSVAEKPDPAIEAGRALYLL